MSEYMKAFKERTGYVSLKEEYMAAMSNLQEKMDKNPEMDIADMDQYLYNAEEEENEESEVF